MAVKFSGVLVKSGNRLWGAHIVVPPSTGKKLTARKSRRVYCSLNGSEERQCALVPYGKGALVVTVNRQLREKLSLEIGGEVMVSLRPDESPYGLPMPEELEELLRQDKEGRQLFLALTPGKRRTLLYIVGSPRNPDLRLARAAVVVQHLRSNSGKVDYKQLYALLGRG